MNIKPPLPTRTHDHARALRSNMTDAERHLWKHLRAGRLEGIKFRRQHPVPPYIVDFVSLAHGLAIELDGSQHTIEGDATRTRYLESQGLRVLRFNDRDVLLNIEGVADVILASIGFSGVDTAAASRTLSPTPLPVGEGL